MENPRIGVAHPSYTLTEETQDLYASESPLPANQELNMLYKDIINNASTRMYGESAADMFPKNEFFWEKSLEDFQDLSEHCQTSSLDLNDHCQTVSQDLSEHCQTSLQSEFIESTETGMAANGGSMNVSQDDELLTPEIDQGSFFELSTLNSNSTTVDILPDEFDIWNGSFIGDDRETTLGVEESPPESIAVLLCSPSQGQVVEQQIELNSAEVIWDDLREVIAEETVVLSEDVGDSANEDNNCDLVNKNVHLPLPPGPVNIFGEELSTPVLESVLEYPAALVAYITQNKPSSSDLVNSSELTVDLSEIQFTNYHPEPKLEIPSGSSVVNTETEVEPIRSTQCHVKGKRGKQTAYRTKKIHVESVNDKIIKTEPSTYIVVSKEEEEESGPLRITLKKEIFASKRHSRYSTRKRSCSSISVADIDDEEEEVKLPTKRGKRQTTCSSEDTSECARYRELRDKNNRASQRSRQSRKAREEEMKFQLAELEEKNQRLRIVEEEKQKQVEALRELLVKVMTSRKE